MKNHYDVLGVPVEASSQQIRKIYRKLAQIYHPDTTVLDKEHAQRKFQELNEAYEILFDKDKRRAYDRDLQRVQGPPRSLTDQQHPLPSPSMAEIDFGTVSRGVKRTQKLVVYNEGQPAQTVDFSHRSEEGWFSLHTQQYSQEQVCPVEVEVSADTNNLQFGMSYEGHIYVYLDEQVVKIPIKIAIASKPDPIVTPEILDFGTLQLGEKQTLRFQLDNRGGPVSKMIDFQQSEENGWFQITQMDRPDKEGDYPMDVAVTVETNSLVEGPYTGWIEIGLDGEIVRVDLAVSVFAKPQPLISVSTMLLQALEKHTEGVWSVAFHPHEETLASGGDDQRVWLWEGANEWQPREPRFWTWLQRLKLGAPSSVWRVVFSPDGKYLAFANWEKVLLWELASSWKTIALPTTKQQHPYSLAFSPDGQFLAADGSPTEIWLWDVASQKQVQQFIGHERQIRTVAFSPTGELLASGSEDGTIRIWSRAGETVRVLQGHAGAVREVAFSPDGTQLVSAGSMIFADGRRHQDNTVRLWDVEQGTLLKVMEGHTKSVECVAFSPQGQIVASSSVDQTVRFWDLESGQEVGCLKEHRKSVNSVAFNSPGDLLATGGWDGLIRLYELSISKEANLAVNERP